MSISLLGAQTGAYEFASSSHLGETGKDQLRDMAVDRFGNVYVTGGMTSPDLQTTAGALPYI